MVDISKEALRIIFNQNYLILVQAFNQSDISLFKYVYICYVFVHIFICTLMSFLEFKEGFFFYFSKQTLVIEQILIDMDELLSTDSRFLLGSWLEQAKTKATNDEEKTIYEWNARNQITLWGLNTTEIVCFFLFN